MGGGRRESRARPSFPVSIRYTRDGMGIPVNCLSSYCKICRGAILSEKNFIYMYKDKFTKTVITINVPVVFMARYVMILRGATSLLRALEEVGPENQDFFGL
jgi:hypothetical protein